MSSFPLNERAAYQRMLRERLARLLGTLPPDLLPLVERALMTDGKLLAPEPTDQTDSAQASNLPTGVWPLLTLLVAQMSEPNIELDYACDVALATECLVCAIDLFDDLIDGDLTPMLTALGQGPVVNAATALILLAQQALFSAVALPDARTNLNALSHALISGAQSVIAGQQRDLLAERLPYGQFNREECLAIAEAKSGSLMRLACRMGALCAEAPPEEVARWEQFGSLLGIAHQLDNDAHDLAVLLPVDPSIILDVGAAEQIKSDLTRGKKTLPIVYACARQELLRGQTALDVPSLPEDVRSMFLRDVRVAIHTAWGISLLYRIRASERFDALAALHPAPPALRSLLGYIEPRTGPEETKET